MHRITKGLDVPIAGLPEQNIVEGPSVSQVALVASDYIGMKPTMLVDEGDRVQLGQPLFADKKNDGVKYTAPAAGTVTAVNRGERRAFQSLVIDVEGDDRIEYEALGSGDFAAVDRSTLTNLLVETGLWTSLRTRPFSKVPALGTVPNSIFVQAIDTNPLAVDPAPVIRERAREFRFGLQALTKLTDGKVFLCRRPAQPMEGEDHPQVQTAEFEGPHPAGLPGTHIHLLDPVGPNKTVWTINYQDVIAIGHLVITGQLSNERIVSVAGPAAKNPRLIRTCVGASLSQLCNGEVAVENARIISGSVLSGRKAEGPFGYLGRYHLQVSILEEASPREFLGMVAPGTNKFSIRRVFASALKPEKRFNFTTDTGGSRRAMVPIGMYEQVMPLDIIPTFLLRSLIVGDTDQAQALGCMELDEEDLGLCTFVCPGKYEYGPILRDNLTQIELEG